MGLHNMYLHGEKYFTGVNGNREKEEGVEIVETHYRFSEWKGQYGLHNFIIHEIDCGYDDGSWVYLEEEEIYQIIDAIEKETLLESHINYTGVKTCEGAEKTKAIAAFKQALEWKSKEENGVIKSIYYKPCF